MRGASKMHCERGPRALSPCLSRARTPSLHTTHKRVDAEPAHASAARTALACDQNIYRHRWTHAESGPPAGGARRTETAGGPLPRCVRGREEHEAAAGAAPEERRRRLAAHVLRGAAHVLMGAQVVRYALRTLGGGLQAVVDHIDAVDCARGKPDSAGVVAILECIARGCSWWYGRRCCQ